MVLAEREVMEDNMLLCGVHCTLHFSV